MELIEREEALQSLQAAALQARHGHGNTALIYGEAGIGKTSLLKAAFNAGANRGGAALRTLWGGCEALFSPRPLGPLHDMADGFSERVRAALTRERARSELFSLALAELKDSPQPTAMIFEDVHWADEATLDFIKYLGRRIETSPVLLVLTYRDDELGERHPLRAVLGDLPAVGVSRIALYPLSEQGVARLSRQLASDRERPGLYAATRGNPFFVTESLRGEGVPATVRDAVLVRAARQGAAVRALLDLVAIVPSRVETSLVEALLHPATEDMAAALASGLLVAQGHHLAFRHELARIALEQALPAPVAAGLHARVLARLESEAGSGVAIARLVHHAAAADQGAAVLRHAPRAAEQAAAQGAHREAAALLAAALEHADTLPAPERAQLLERRAYECYLVDQIDAALEAREAALAIWQHAGNREREGHTLRWLSRLSWFSGRNARAIVLAERAIEILQAMPPGLELAWAMSNRAQLHMLNGETQGAVDWGQRAIALAEQIGALEVKIHALNNVGAALHLAGVDDGRHTVERSLQLALQHNLPEHVARAYVNLVSECITQRDYMPARRYAEEASAYFAERDLDSWANYLAAWVCRMDLEQDHWSSAASIALGLLQRRPMAAISRLPALAVLARLRLRRNDPGAMQALHEASTIARDTGELQRLAPVAAVHAEAAWLGHADADLDLVREVFGLAQAQASARALGELGFWLQALGERPAVPASPMEPPYADQMAGRWREACAKWQALGCRYERALALHFSGDVAAMHEALAEVEAMGANATAERMREAMRSQGVKGIARGPRTSTAEHPAGLTQREAQVLQLMAQGLTNAEIAQRLVRSAKTVDHHVSAILGKLNARSRAEASAMAAQLGLLRESSAAPRHKR